MPPIAEVAAKVDVQTAPFSIACLHGPDRAGIEKQIGGAWDKIVAPKDEGLKAAVDITRPNVAVGLGTYVNVDNHHEGCAPLTVRRLLETLGQA